MYNTTKEAEISKLLSCPITLSYYNWNVLLKFIEQNKDSLDKYDFDMLMCKSEEYRSYLNKNNNSYIEYNDVYTFL